MRRVKPLTNPLSIKRQRARVGWLSGTKGPRSAMKLLIPLLLLIIALGGTLILWQLTQPQPEKSVPMPTLPEEVKAFEPTTSSISWVSSDGAVSLKVELTLDSPDSKTYTVSVHPELKEHADQLIFTKTVPASTNYDVPFNSWSPDNKYFFIEEHSDGLKQVLVYRADGQSFKNGQPFLNVTQAFSEKLSGFTIKEVTGWASPTLLVVNAKGENDQTDGPSFWYEVTSRSFIRLSSNFN